MKAIGVALAVAALTASPALAQVGASRCAPDITGALICQPTVEEQLDRQMRDLDSFQVGPARRGATPNPASARQATILKMNVGSLIAQGKCDDALDLALKGRDVDAASVVREVCAKH